jgi:putative tryptophan/tyrosine transport system substrate-binding protein
MKRREFIAGLGSAGAWPMVARAQGSKLPTIGFLGTVTESAWAPWTAAFVRRLGELGWVDGRNVAIDFRWANERTERFAEIATEFVSLKVDIIVTASTPAVLAAKHSTSVIPIVFAGAGDPVRNGLVASLARPGGNVTGLSTQGADIAGKRIELLRELVPNLHRLAILYDAGNPATVLEMGEAQEAAAALSFEVVRVGIRQVEELDSAFAAFRGRADGLYVCQSNLIVANRIQVNALALSTRLPTTHNLRSYTQAGGVLSYGASLADQFARAADLVNKILRGAKPADLPVQQPTKYELVINLKTAHALGLTVPPTLLARADEVIE